MPEMCRLGVVVAVASHELSQSTASYCRASVTLSTASIVWGVAVASEVVSHAAVASASRCLPVKEVVN